MKKSLSAFMAGIIDYAGIFPPAALDMKTAIHNYSVYKKGTHQDFLAAFVCPAAKLRELYEYETLFKSEPIFKFSVLCTAGADIATYADSISDQLNEIAAFTKKMGAAAVITSLEIKLPWQTQDAQAIVKALNSGARLISAAVPDEVNVYYEIPRSNNWMTDVALFTEAIATHNTHFDAKTRYNKGGFKIRTGGVEASMFPTVEEVASAIYHCNKNGVPFKATAGLHHPIRHFREELQTNMHGFLNVFGAGVLAKTHQLNEAKITSILLEEDVKQFRLNDHFFTWGKLKAGIHNLEEARSSFAVSFGSCSFDEPVDDLKTAGFL